MEFVWDEAKRLANLAKHGVDFADAELLDWKGAIVYPDLRREYGEPRLIAFIPLGERIHVLVYVSRNESTCLISFRKANAREVRRYEEEKARS